MELEVYEVKTESGKKVLAVGLKSLLKRLRVLDVSFERNDKLVLSALFEGLMGVLNELPEDYYSGKGQAVTKTPEEPPEVVRKKVKPEIDVEIEGDIPKPPKKKQVVKDEDEDDEDDDEDVDSSSDDEDEDDEFPLR